ncbi:MAG: hypothetical protein U5O39_12080 [Gammaproteobacteria bacterium]|nr:hypothetical protein [Gammaproteobacteria bacterium]
MREFPADLLVQDAAGGTSDRRLIEFAVCYCRGEFLVGKPIRCRHLDVESGVQRWGRRACAEYPVRLDESAESPSRPAKCSSEGPDARRSRRH